jgi:hypothetical protein
MPIAENKYKSDKEIIITTSCIIVSCVIGYFIFIFF